jgi:hypothetical protein
MNLAMIQLMARMSAQRALLIQLLALACLNEPDPLGAARLLRDMRRRAPIQPPPGGSGLDPAQSDLMASLADEEIEAILEEVIAHLARSPEPALG